VDRQGVTMFQEACVAFGLDYLAAVKKALGR
jgi:hypothetical protein